jgi:hypothetical protein
MASVDQIQLIKQHQPQSRNPGAPSAVAGIQPTSFTDLNWRATFSCNETPRTLVGNQIRKLWPDVYLWLLFARSIFYRFSNNFTGALSWQCFLLSISIVPSSYFPHLPSVWAFRQILTTCFIFQATFFPALHPNKWLVWKSAVTPRWNLFVRRITSFRSNYWVSTSSHYRHRI